MKPRRQQTTGDGPGLPRNDSERADNAWLRDTVSQARATRELHSSMALWQPGDRFRVWCGVCGYVGNGDRDKAKVQAWAAEHQAASMDVTKPDAASESL